MSKSSIAFLYFGFPNWYKRKLFFELDKELDVDLCINSQDEILLHKFHSQNFLLKTLSFGC